MTVTREMPMTVNENGKRIYLDLRVWHSAVVEIWSEVFGRWLRTDQRVSLKPRQSPGGVLDRLAKEHGVRFHEIRLTFLGPDYL